MAKIIQYSMKFAKEAKIKMKLEKIKGTLLDSIPLVEKSITATDIIYIKAGRTGYFKFFVEIYI